MWGWGGTEGRGRVKAWEKGQRGKGDYERWRGKFRSKGEVHELCRKGGGGLRGHTRWGRLETN